MTTLVPIYNKIGNTLPSIIQDPVYPSKEMSSLIQSLTASQ
jgi:hypothetical protein